MKPNLVPDPTSIPQLSVLLGTIGSLLALTTGDSLTHQRQMVLEGLLHGALEGNVHAVEHQGKVQPGIREKQPHAPESPGVAM